MSGRKQKPGEIDREEHDYTESLTEQLDFLVNNCKMYDQGKYNYAKQIALNIRVIIFDSYSSTSVLTHLGKKESMQFCSTAPFPKKAVYFNELTTTIDRFNESNTIEHTFIPILNANKEHGKKWVDFETWFKQKILVSNPDSFTREDMLRYMANQDGGGHIDAYIQEKYYKISKGIESMLYTAPVPLEEGNPFYLGKPYLNLHFAVIRQIAHELILSIRKEFGIRPNYNPSIKNYNNGKEVKMSGFMITEGDKVEYEL